MDIGFPEGEWLTRELVRLPRLPVRAYLEVGTMEDVRFETRERPRHGSTTVLTARRHLRDVLAAKGYVMKYYEFVGIHRSLSWHGTFADGATFAFTPPISKR